MAGYSTPYAATPDPDAAQAAAVVIQPAPTSAQAVSGQAGLGAGASN
jgi:hypothetical protein